MRSEDVSFQGRESKAPFGSVGVAKALIAISSHLGETHSSSTRCVAFVASRMGQAEQTDCKRPTMAPDFYIKDLLSEVKEAGRVE